MPLGPEARYEQTEAISLAFATALQLLPARQRAALILHDVLGYRAHEAATILDTTVDAIDSALKRGRATLRERMPRDDQLQVPPAPGSHAERLLVGKFVEAYRSGDVSALVALLTEEICISMPPITNEYVGRDAAARFYAAMIGGGRRYTFAATRANGQSALTTYIRGATGRRAATGIAVLTLAGDRISAVTRFSREVLHWFLERASSIATRPQIES